MDEIARLRRLLGIVEDREAVDQIGERVVDRNLRARDIAEVLPEAVRKAEREGRLTPSLQAPIETTLRKTITRDPKAFADVLFPVMGPAIRRSIAETLRAALEGLNRALELGFSARGLRWRLEAWRTGVPFREVVLRHTMAYRVREAFLISKTSGLLMVRAGEPGSAALDRDAVAAMLTAIEDFVADSTGGEQDELSSAEVGGHVLWVLSGYAARLALVVEGQPPRSVRTRLQEILERIHGHYGAWMESYDGSAEPDPGLVEEVASCVMSETLDRPDADQRRGAMLPALIVLSLVALGLAAWLAWTVLDNRREAARWTRLQALLAQEPGLVYVASSGNGDAPRVTVLADSGAASPEDLARRAGFEAGRIEWSIQPFLSPEPELVASRLRQALAPVPATISITAGKTDVVVAGAAPAAWLERLRQYADFHWPREPIRLGPLRASDAEVPAEPRPDAEVPAEAQPDSGAPAESEPNLLERIRAEATLAEDFAAVEVDWSGFEGVRERLADAGRRLDEEAVGFGPGEIRNPDYEAAETAAIVREIEELAARCDCRVELVAVGCSDDSGPAALNRSIRTARAEWLREALLGEYPGAAPVALDVACTGTKAAARRAYLRVEVSDR